MGPTPGMTTPRKLEAHEAQDLELLSDLGDRIRFAMYPGDLVRHVIDEESCGLIVSVDRNTCVVNWSNIPDLSPQKYVAHRLKTAISNQIVREHNDRYFHEKAISIMQHQLMDMMNQKHLVDYDITQSPTDPGEIKINCKVSTSVNIVQFTIKIH